MSFTVFYKDNPANPTLFYKSSTIDNLFNIVSFTDYIRPNSDYTKYLIAFYVASNGANIFMEVNSGISYFRINSYNLSKTWNQSLAVSSSVQPFPYPPVANFYYLTNYTLSVAINLFTNPCPLQMYILCVPNNFVLSGTDKFPSGAKSTVLYLYFQQKIIIERPSCPIEGCWELTRIVYNSNNTANSDANFTATLQYFISHNIILQLFEQFKCTPTWKILPLYLAVDLQSAWTVNNPFNGTCVYPICNTP